MHVSALFHAIAHPSPSRCINSPVTCFRRKRMDSMLTAQCRACPQRHRVQGFHLIPLFSRTRMCVSLACKVAHLPQKPESYLIQGKPSLFYNKVHCFGAACQSRKSCGIKEKPQNRSSEVSSGGEYRTRTCDPLHVKQML